MKKFMAVFLMSIITIPLFAITLSPSIGIKSNEYETPLYIELLLTEKFDVISLEGTYKLGYDIKNEGHYNFIGFGVRMSFNWGSIVLSKSYGNDINQTEFRLEF
jgi:hypothetical protein